MYCMPAGRPPTAGATDRTALFLLRAVLVVSVGAAEAFLSADRDELKYVRSGESIEFFCSQNGDYM
jgi:hypothetical protein